MKRFSRFDDFDAALYNDEQSLYRRDYLRHHRKATIVLSAMLIVGALLLLAIVGLTIFAKIYHASHGPYGYGPFIIPIAFFLLFSIDFMAFPFVYSYFFEAHLVD